MECAEHLNRSRPAGPSTEDKGEGFAVGEGGGGGSDAGNVAGVGGEGAATGGMGGVCAAFLVALCEEGQVFFLLSVFRRSSVLASNL